MKHKAAVLVVIIIASFLRLYKLDAVPASLFGDELDVGYQAYSIAQTGRDYQGNFLPLHFHSLAEWRTPLYLYSAVPTVALFGITPYGVRLPAALFGIAGIGALYLFVKLITKSESLPFAAAFFLAVSPWHIQYSRAGFEVTEMIFFLLMGLYFFFKSMEKPKYLWLAVLFIMLTPWVYSTAKLYVPIVVIGAFLLWRKRLVSLGRKYIVPSIMVGLVLGLPLIYTTFNGESGQRFGYISVFSDPTIEPEVGVARGVDASYRGETGTGLSPTFADRLFHNKFTNWAKVISTNYIQAFSADFLVVDGDPNPRHSIDGQGEFYKADLAILFVGLVAFLKSKLDKKTKVFLVVLLLFSALPACLTRDGGNHATRLILMLPFLVVIASFGLSWIFRFRLLFLVYCFLFIFSFIFYQHNYWVHNPYQSERWWHAGWGEAIADVKGLAKGFDKVIISMKGEPAWIFFAGHYMYLPSAWQAEFPISAKVSLRGFGEVSFIDKFYFGSPNVEGGIYSLPELIDAKTLYLANASEVGGNLLKEPAKTPIGLTLLKSVAFPSGEPAFYLFTKSTTHN